MIPNNDIHLFECPFGHNSKHTISNAFIPSSLIAWSYYIMYSNNCSNNNVDAINSIDEGIGKLILQIKALISELVQTNQDVNYNPEINIPMIDDLFVRKYLSALRCIQDCYQIMSITIQVLLLTVSLSIFNAILLLDICSP